MKKKLGLILTGFVLFFLSINANAQSQSTTDFFTGKWNVLAVGTPSGDTKMLVSLQGMEGKLVGTIDIGEQSEPTKFSQVEEKENSVTLYFTISGHDVHLQLEKKGENNVEGTLMGMFDATGTRIVENEKN